MFLHYAQTCNLFVHFFMLSHAKKIAALQSRVIRGIFYSFIYR
ncbi:Uncharacterised protein [Klebsiella pneumoniae]|uniref:Uncharacterized protein n=1 Tax=Klebsiella pneumoniae TaxID=573 RepID=A0A378H5Y0_KLEPN|nr:Uncharacterised protein [Klebsiella pneumoniae]